MAERPYSKEEQLKQHAFAVRDMITQLKGASMEPVMRYPISRGRGRGRGAGYNQNHPQMQRRHREKQFQSYPWQRTSHDSRINVNDWYEVDSYGRQQRHYPLQSKLKDEVDDVVTPETLVLLLMEFPGFSASLLQLMEDKHLNPSMVRNVISSRPRLFSLQSEKVVLKPDISLCIEYLGSESCGDRLSCKKLHICPKYISGICVDENCILGHSWKTNHNSRVLELLCLKQLPTTELQKLFKGLGLVTKPKETVEICLAYNTQGCNISDCDNLHVCYSLILDNMKCSKTDCKLNHDILDERNSQILESHGFSANETPRDITVALLASNPLLREKLKSLKQKKDTNEETSKTVLLADTKDISSDSLTMKEESDEKSKGTDISANENGSVDENADGSDHGSFCNDSDSSDKQLLQASNSKKVEISGEVDESDDSDSSDGKEKGGVPKSINRRTLWSHYLQGDTQIPEICFYSVERMCNNEASVCPRLHATQHYHWQVSEQGKRWLNLRPAQAKALECAYCDASEEGIDLPRLDPATVDMSVSGLFILMGRDIWHADFKAMTLTNSSDTIKLNIRRLCTEIVQGHNIKASSFVWYFLDRNKTWVKYGSADTTGRAELITNLTSNDLEKTYLQNPSASVSFTNAKFKYILDFKTMTQTNQQTMVSREVRRRPEPHLQEEESLPKKREEDNEFPLTWDPMQSGERTKLVPLASSSTEYQTVINLFAGQLSTSLVKQIERIQNPFLWRALQNKIKEMITIHGDEAKVDVRQVFHGTQHTVVSSICSENFDWRLHGTNTGQMYGRGTYFSTNAKYSYNYCKADTNGDKHMFIARVAVGSIAAGDSSLARPPNNPATNAPFDSTVDNVQNFTILVKYDKQEYYPEYLLTLV